MLLVPLWLGLTRQALLDQGPAAAAAVVAGGLMLFLLSDSIHKSCARQATCVTAATLQQQLQTGTRPQCMQSVQLAHAWEHRLLAAHSLIVPHRSKVVLKCCQLTGTFVLPALLPCPCSGLQQQRTCNPAGGLQDRNHLQHAQ